MLKISKPFYYITISAILGAVITYLLVVNPFKIAPAYATNTTTPATNSNDQSCEYRVERMQGYKLIKPLLFADPECESPSLDNIKNSISNYIDAEKTSGKIISASLYLRVFPKGKLTSCNVDEHYHPASMNKVPVLITFMKMAEKKPSLLDEKLLFQKRDNSVPEQFYTSKTIETGHSYTIRELLRYMIGYSDNEATTLLWGHMDFKEYDKTYTDLGLSKPSFNFDEQQLSAKQYATFLKVLYNGSYLSNTSSEFCFSLLSQSDFKDGLLKKIPAGVMVAHKFGECTYAVTHAPGEKPYGKLSELHESGVIYRGDFSYLIVIMSKGPDMKHLSDVVGEISAMVYNSLSKPAGVESVTEK